MKIRNTQTGAGLVELLVALVLSLFLLAGLFTIFFSTRRSYDAAQALSALQDNQTLAAHILANTVRQAGFFPYSVTGYTSRSGAFPGNTTIMGTSATWSAGQVIYATGSSGGPDQLFMRIIPSLTTLNCLGHNSMTRQTNTFKLIDTKVSPHSLACTVTGHPSSALVSPLGTLGTNPNGGGVQNMQVLIGISSGATSSVDQYLAPNQMTQADWLRARSVTLTLSFYNPLFNAVASASKTNIDRQGQPRFITLTQVIRLENLGGSGERNGK